MLYAHLQQKDRKAIKLTAWKNILFQNIRHQGSINLPREIRWGFLIFFALDEKDRLNTLAGLNGFEAQWALRWDYLNDQEP